MNVFEVLSQGKSRLHEPSVSAMLGYLLNPNENHGIGDLFLRNFLAMLDKCWDGTLFSHLLEQQKRINAIVELEVQYHLLSRNDIDIQIQILENDKETHRIIIENKIRSSAASPQQLNKYYQAVLHDKDVQAENPIITMVFLTPDDQKSKLSKEWNNLKDLNEEHQKAWLFWSSEDVSRSVVDLVRDLLHKEVRCEINPINEYMRHTIKAFVNFIISKTSITQKTMRTGQDIGNITDRQKLVLNNGKHYTVVRRDSSQIQVFDDEKDKKMIARHIMSQYIDEQGIDIPHNRLNTRSIGKKLIEYLAQHNHEQST